MPLRTRFRIPDVAGLLALAAIASCGSPGRPEGGEATSPEAAPRPPLGFSPTGAGRMEAASRRIVEAVEPAKLSECLKEVTAAPHVAGTPADFRTAEQVHRRFLLFGWESRIEEYEVLLPYPEEVAVEMVRPLAFQASLRELPLDLDFDTHTSAAIPPFLAYSPDGDVTGPLVYVNRGSDEDFRELAERGVALRGAIGIARAGALYRGSKVRNAARAGMKGLLVYSDPADDGYMKGEVHPAGPWRPGSAVERGSILDIAERPGDPLTPGVAALPGARRIAARDADVIPRIPALPLAHDDARPLLEHLKGASVPDRWQGGLPFAYHIGGTADVLVRVKVRSSWEVRRIWNVIARLPGAVAPDQWVIAGSHRDAWVHGAVDPGSGTAALLETARVLGDLARQGVRPARTIVICSWDAEEFGLIGSVEHVEQHRETLERNAVLYLNADAVVSGGKMSASAGPEIAEMLRDALRAVPDERSEGKSVAETLAAFDAAPAGGGSDHVPFQHVLGAPCATVGTSGPYGVYHSLYDTYGWMKRHGDPEFRHHARLTRVLADFLLRAASATIIPYDYEALAAWIRKALDAAPVDRGAPAFVDLAEALDVLADGARAWREARDAALALDPSPSSVAAVNAALVASLRVLTADGVDPGRPFYRHLLTVVSDADGYGRQALPGIAVPEGGAAADTEAVAAAAARLAAALREIAARIERFRSALPVR